MEPITQDKRVSQGHNGDLYFSNVMLQDMQTDYSCNARFHFTHTIQQKNPFTLKVLTSKWRPCLGLSPVVPVPKSTHHASLRLAQNPLWLTVPEPLPLPYAASEDAESLCQM